MSNIVSRTLSVHQEHEVLLALEKAGLDSRLAQLIIDSRGNKRAEGIIKNLIGYEEKMSLARSIFGDNFLSPEDIETAFPNLHYSNEQKERLALELLSGETLQEVKESNGLLYPSPSKAMFLKDIIDLKPDYFKATVSQEFENSSFFDRDMIKMGWVLISEEKSRSIARAVEIAWGMVAYRRVHDKKLFRDIWIRTSSKSENHNGHVISIKHSHSGKKMLISAASGTNIHNKNLYSNFKTS